MAKAIGRYLVLDIGCIECAEGSSVVGLFDEREAAARECMDAAERQAKNWRGGHEFLLIDLHNPPKSEYAPAEVA